MKPEQKDNKTTAGRIFWSMMFVITIVLLVIKCYGVNISYLWVFTPLYGPVLLLLAGVLISILVSFLKQKPKK